MYEQAAEITSVFKKWAAEKQADLLLTSQAAEQASFDGQFAPEMPQYQQRNWLLAYRAYNFLADRDGLPKLTTAQLQITQALQVPARMERRHVAGKTVIMDGAHNAQKMGAFLASFRQAYPGVKPAVLLALKQSKEPHGLVPLLAPLASRLIITTFDTSQDLPAKSMEPAELGTLFTTAGATVQAIADQHAAYQALLAGPEAVVIITGSFYLLSQLREREQLT
jgi:dihydrofolate synthase/folylpolyglutamate synthase